MEEKLASVLTDFGAGRFDVAALDKATSATGDAESCDIMLFEGNSHKDPISGENGDNTRWNNLASSFPSYGTFTVQFKRGQNHRV